MFPQKDYANMTREELLAAESKANAQKTPTALLIGVLVGVAVWSATHKGFVLPVILLGLAVFIGNRDSRQRKRIQAEISRRDTLG